MRFFFYALLFQIKMIILYKENNNIIKKKIINKWENKTKFCPVTNIGY